MSRYVAPHRLPGWGGCERCGRVTFMVDDEDRHCRECRDRLGLPQRATGAYVPWYARLSPEEYAAILARRWIPTPRWDERAELPLTGRAVVEIDYPRPGKEDTIRLMVGSVIPHPEHKAILFHSYSQTGEGAQAHHLTDSPCPVDTVLAEFLLAVGVRWYFGYDKDHETLWKAPVARIADAPVMEYQARTVRRRHFLAAADFADSLTRVVMRRDGGGHQLVHVAARPEVRVLRVPFVPESETVVLHTVGGR